MGPPVTSQSLPLMGGMKLAACNDVHASVPPLPFVNTHENLADFFTKPLEPKKFFAFRNVIMNHRRSM